MSGMRISDYCSFMPLRMIELKYIWKLAGNRLPDPEQERQCHKYLDSNLENIELALLGGEP